MKILGIGNAIVDVLCKIEDSFLQDNQLIKGSMSLIDEATTEKLKTLKSEKITSGGSVANTIASLGQMGVNTGFIGKVANDQLGQKFISELEKTGTKFLNKNFADSFSATSFILVSRDAQRTMCTYLGCASQIFADEIIEENFKNLDILYIEGYLWDTKPEALLKAIELAKKHQVKIAFSLSDAFCVVRHKQDFLRLIKNDLDILFANEAEILELLDLSEFETKKISEFLSSNPKLIAAITRSEKGCVVFANQKYFELPAEKIEKLIDTTGAGDAFAAGFLYGLINNFDLQKSAQFGNKLAAKIIQKFAARFDEGELENEFVE